MYKYKESRRENNKRDEEEEKKKKKKKERKKEYRTSELIQREYLKRKFGKEEVAASCSWIIFYLLFLILSPIYDGLIHYTLSLGIIR